MTAEYFEARERALLGPRYDSLYAAPGANAARGVTVSALRMDRAAFAAGAGFGIEPSPFCPDAFVVREPGFKPGRHPWHHAGVFYAQEPSAAAAAPLLGVRPGMRVLLALPRFLQLLLRLSIGRVSFRMMMSVPCRGGCPRWP